MTTAPFCYWYLPVSALCVANSDEFHATNCINMRIDIGHRSYFLDKEFIGNTPPVIDTETRNSVGFRNDTHR